MLKSDLRSKPVARRVIHANAIRSTGDDSSIARRLTLRVRSNFLLAAFVAVENDVGACGSLDTPDSERWNKAGVESGVRFTGTAAFVANGRVVLAVRKGDGAARGCVAVGSTFSEGVGLSDCQLVR